MMSSNTKNKKKRGVIPLGNEIYDGIVAVIKNPSLLEAFKKRRSTLSKTEQGITANYSKYDLATETVGNIEYVM